MDKQVKECRSAPFATPKIWRGAQRSRSKFAGVTERRSSSWSGYPSLVVALSGGTLGPKLPPLPAANISSAIDPLGLFHEVVG